MMGNYGSYYVVFLLCSPRQYPDESAPEVFTDVSSSFNFYDNIFNMSAGIL